MDPFYHFIVLQWEKGRCVGHLGWSSRMAYGHTLLHKCTGTAYTCFVFLVQFGGLILFASESTTTRVSSPRGREIWVDLPLLIPLPTLSQVVNFPPALYEYVTGELGLALVLVLNKVDLAPPALVVAWKHYFHQHFPQLHIILFTSFPRDPRTPQDPSSGEYQ